MFIYDIPKQFVKDIILEHSRAMLLTNDRLMYARGAFKTCCLWPGALYMKNKTAITSK